MSLPWLVPVFLRSAFCLPWSRLFYMFLVGRPSIQTTRGPAHRRCFQSLSLDPQKLPQPLAMMSHLGTRPWINGTGDYGPKSLKLWVLSPKQILPSLSYRSQIFCPRDKHILIILTVSTHSWKQSPRTTSLFEPALLPSPIQPCGVCPCLSSAPQATLQKNSYLPLGSFFPLWPLC